MQGKGKKTEGACDAAYWRRDAQSTAAPGPDSTCSPPVRALRHEPIFRSSAAGINVLLFRVSFFPFLMVLIYRTCLVVMCVLLTLLNFFLLLKWLLEILRNQVVTQFHKFRLKTEKIFLLVGPTYNIGYTHCIPQNDYNINESKKL